MDNTKPMVDVEPAEYEAYLSADATTPDAVRLTYLKARYEETKREYESLKLTYWEAEGAKRDEMKQRLEVALKENYKSRKWLVQAIRKFGEPCEDRFVIG
jgi:hypothetical protein